MTSSLLAAPNPAGNVGPVYDLVNSLPWIVALGLFLGGLVVWQIFVLAGNVAAMRGARANNRPEEQAQAQGAIVRTGLVIAALVLFGALLTAGFALL